MLLGTLWRQSFFKDSEETVHVLNTILPKSLSVERPHQEKLFMKSYPSWLLSLLGNIRLCLWEGIWLLKVHVHSTFTLNLFATRLRAFHWLFMERFKKIVWRTVLFCKELTFYSGKAKVYPYKNSLLYDLEDFRRIDHCIQERLLWRGEIWSTTGKDRVICVCTDQRKEHYDAEEVWAKEWTSWSHVGPGYRKQRICIEN